MEQKDDDLFGMTPDAAKEYVAAFITTRNLTEKKRAEAAEAASKWTDRAALALRKGEADLAAAAETEAGKAAADRDRLGAEIVELDAKIERMRRQLPGLAARQRSVDPDLLEQELRMAAGGDPGTEPGEAETARRIAALEKEAAAEDQLAALKARLREQGADR